MRTAIRSRYTKRSGDSNSLAKRRLADLKRGRKALGLRLGELREARGLSQRVLATMLGCSQVTIFRGEKSGNVEFVLLELWAAALGVTVMDLKTQPADILSFPVWAPEEPHYFGHSAQEWIAFNRDGRFPTPPGFPAFASAYTELFGYEYQPGDVKRAFLIARAKEQGIIKDQPEVQAEE